MGRWVQDPKLNGDPGGENDTPLIAIWKSGAQCRAASQISPFNQDRTQSSVSLLGCNMELTGRGEKKKTDCPLRDDILITRTE